MIDALLRLILRLEGLKGRFIMTSLGRVRVYMSRTRKGPPALVLIHGIGCNSGHFYLIIPYLISKFKRVIAIDLPGHGASDDPNVPMSPDTMYSGVAQTLDALMSAGVLEVPFFIKGNSLGGAVVVRYASEFPDRIKGMILTSPAIGFEREKDWLVLHRVLRTNTPRARHRFARAALDRSKWMLPLGLYLLRRSFNRPPVKELLKNAHFKDVNVPKGVQIFQGPSLLVWGREEKVFPRKNLDWLKAHLGPQSRILNPPGIGHCPHFDKPGWFAREVIDFGQSLSQSQSHSHGKH